MRRAVLVTLLALGGCALEPDYGGRPHGVPFAGLPPLAGAVAPFLAQAAYEPVRSRERARRYRGQAAPVWTGRASPPPARFIPGPYGPQVGTGYTRPGYAQRSPHPYGHVTRTPDPAETMSTGN